MRAFPPGASAALETIAHLPFAGAFWQSSDGGYCMDASWYYIPEDTACGRLPGHDRREVFESVHSDENPIESIDGLCRVLSWDEYQQWLTEEADDDDDDDEDVCVCRAQYHPGTGEIRPLSGANSFVEAFKGVGRRGLADSANAKGAKRVRHGAPKLSRFTEAASRLTPSAAPERLPCRDHEREVLTSTLRESIKAGGVGASLYISGTPGTGKTATVHQALRTLAQEVSANKLPNFRTLELNGMKLSSPHQVYTLLWESLSGQHCAPPKASQLLDRRFSGAEKGRKSHAPKAPLVLVLDELDYLVTRTQSVIYNLFEWATSANSALVIVGISNTMDLPERLLPRVHSRLGIRRLNFHPYSVNDISAIIHERISNLEAFEHQGVELCARKVASVSGDVRRALEVCRLAAQLAEREELDALDDGENCGANKGAANTGAAKGKEPPKYVGFKHIDAAVKQLRGSCVLRAMTGLPLQQLLMLSCIVIVQSFTGRSEVEFEAVAQHHSTLCVQHEFLASGSAPSEAEQRKLAAYLCSSRFISASPPSANATQLLQLTVQPDDVRWAARQHSQLAPIFAAM